MRVVIYGSRPDGHAKVVLELVQALGMECVGFLDDFPENQDRRWRGLTVLGGKELLPDLAGEVADAVAFGFSDGRARMEMVSGIEAAGLELPVLVSPRASVSETCSLGAGSQVHDGARLGPDVEVGAAALINTSATIGHDSKLGAGVTLGPGTMVCGRVTIGDGATTGAGATLIPDAIVGSSASVGAGAVVLSTVADGDVVVGVPARPAG